MEFGDIVNGLFEVGGIFALWTSILQLHKDKESKGVHWAHLAFFSSWGLWNVYYYPSLDQWASFAGGTGLCISNFIYLGQILYYRNKNK